MPDRTPNGPRLQRNATFAALVPVVAVLTGAVTLFFVVKGPAMWCVNDMARWDTVWSLVEKGTYAIGTDEAPEPWPTIDKVKKDGIYYSAKTPLLPTVLAKDYWIIRTLTGWRLTEPEHTGAITKLILLKWNVLFLVAFVWLYGRYLWRHAGSIWGRPYWLLAGAFGTYVTGYSVTLNNHTIAAVNAFFALYFLVRILHDKEDRWYYYLAAGASAGWAATNEMSAAALTVCVVALLLLKGDWRRTLLWAVPPILILVVAFFATNYLEIGMLKPAQMQKNTELYHYAGSYWNTPQGLDALHEPWWKYTLHMTIGHHGILSLNPILAFVVVSFVLFLSGRTRKLPELHWMSLGLTALIWVYYTFATNVDHNYGGGCKGLRWAFWLMPLWLMVAPLGSELYARKRWVRGLALGALAVSVYSTLDALTSPWGISWLHGLCRAWHIVSY